MAPFVWIVMPTRDVPLPVLSLTPPPVPAVAQVVYPKTPSPAAKPRILPAARPLPLTAEERALLRFVQSQPEQARAALVLSAQIEPLTIEPLKIEELP